MVEDYIYKQYKADVFGIESDIEVFVTHVMDEKTLATQWKEIRNQVALNQTDLDDEFERWNFYLFYVVDNPVADLSLKYEIEHDTISSRKMVVKAEAVSDALCNSLISKYIKYDLDSREVIFDKVFEKNSSVARFVGILWAVENSKTHHCKNHCPKEP